MLATFLAFSANMPNLSAAASGGVNRPVGRLAAYPLLDASLRAAERTGRLAAEERRLGLARRR